MNIYIQSFLGNSNIISDFAFELYVSVRVCVCVSCLHAGGLTVSTMMQRQGLWGAMGGDMVRYLRVTLCYTASILYAQT